MAAIEPYAQNTPCLQWGMFRLQESNTMARSPDWLTIHCIVPTEIFTKFGDCWKLLVVVHDIVHVQTPMDRESRKDHSDSHVSGFGKSNHR